MQVSSPEGGRVTIGDDRLGAERHPHGAAVGPGTRIGLYSIVEQIGRGGMEVVYRAEQQYPVRARSP